MYMLPVLFTARVHANDIYYGNFGTENSIRHVSHTNNPNDLNKCNNIHRLRVLQMFLETKV